MGVKLSICVLTKNRIDWLKLTINHLLIELKFINIKYEVLVLCGDSNDGTIDYLKSLENIKVIQNVNEGVARAVIKCEQVAQGDYVLVIHDHMFIKMKIISNACAAMDNNQLISCLFFKPYIAGDKIPFKNHYLNLNSLLFSDVFLFRKEELSLIDKHYKHYYWNTDLAIQLMLQGKMVASTKEVSGVEFKINYDRTTNPVKWRERETSESTIYFKEKYHQFINIIGTDQSYVKLINIKVFSILHKYFVRLINTSIFHRIENFINLFGYKSSYETLYPELYDRSLPIEYVEFMKSKGIEKFDRRCGFSFIEKTLMWLIEKTSGYVINHKKVNGSLFLVQKLPDIFIKKFNYFQN